MNMKTIRLVAKQLCAALFELKNIGGDGIIHGDLKPDNIMFEGCIAKIADFGFAQLTSLSIVSGACNLSFILKGRL